MNNTITNPRDFFSNVLTIDLLAEAEVLALEGDVISTGLIMDEVATRFRERAEERRDDICLQAKAARLDGLGRRFLERAEARRRLEHAERGDAQ